jgi:hypothetical protein
LVSLLWLVYIVKPLYYFSLVLKSTSFTPNSFPQSFLSIPDLSSPSEIRTFRCYKGTHKLRPSPFGIHLRSQESVILLPEPNSLPSSYAGIFDVPDMKPHTEWSLIDGKGSISPFYVDSEGLATVVVVLEDSKYWVVATQIKDAESIYLVDSLGPIWDPYIFNVEDNADRFHFKAIYLRKGDML